MDQGSIDETALNFFRSLIFRHLSLVHRLRERARIRRQIDTRKSVQEGKPDRISDLLEEAADRIEELEVKGMLR